MTPDYPARFSVLEQPATQEGFAWMVGISQQAVAKLVGTILTPGATYRGWLLQYTSRHREMAAGRGGDQAAALAAKARKDNLMADQIEMRLAQEAGKLVPVEEIEPQLTAMVTAFRVELLGMVGHLRHAIKKEHGVDVPRSLIEGYVHRALEHLADPDGDVSPGAAEVIPNTTKREPDD